jgi:hypothetical protein
MASAASGVRVCSSVDFGSVRSDASLRVLRLSITGTALDLIKESGRAAASGKGEAHDFDNVLAGLAEPDKGSYLLFRLDSGKVSVVCFFIFSIVLFSGNFNYTYSRRCVGFCFCFCFLLFWGFLMFHLSISAISSPPSLFPSPSTQHPLGSHTLALTHVATNLKTPP